MGYFTRFISASRLDQWNVYNSIWKTYNMKNGCHWFDIPGNHDYTTDEYRKKLSYVNEFTSKGSELPFYIAPLFKSGEEEVCLIGIDETYDPSNETCIFFICRGGLLDEHLRGYSSIRVRFYRK